MGVEQDPEVWGRGWGADGEGRGEREPEPVLVLAPPCLLRGLDSGLSVFIPTVG